MTKSGFVEYAASNDIIMVFPQAWMTPSNDGCFDSWGATSNLYDADTNENRQVQWTLNVIDALTEDRLEGFGSGFVYEWGNRLKHRFYWFWMNAR